MKKKIVIAVGLALVAGFVIGKGCAPRQTGGDVTTTGDIQTAGKAEIWTCSMHPQIRQPKPGKCPICAMDLIPAGGGVEDETTNPRQLAMSPAAEKLAEVRLAPVERRYVEADVRMVGKVQLDETRVAYIASRVSGRIDRLYVNFNGVPVKKGDHLADVYSPELVSAQQELIQAVDAVRNLENGGAAEGLDSARAILDSAREKLRLWQLTPEQIVEVELSGKPRDHLTFYSPIAGVVVERMDTFEGMYVETGMKLFTLADLSRVWVKLDAYESDLAWLRYGQTVEFEVEAYPGETFHGTIAFIDPVLDPMTRTVKVRVNAMNPDGRLKPEMFVRATVRARVTAEGRVIQPDYAGKWISPMHPEIVKDGPGTCDVCGMPLVRTEELGYAGVEPPVTQAPLVIPASAPLITGERAVVYVAVPDKKGVFEGREVVLGPRARDVYLVRSGLKEGDLVVVNGAFKIDSSLQIQGRISMMQPEAGVAPVGHTHGGPPTAAGKEPTSSRTSLAPLAFQKQIGAVVTAYFRVADALAGDRLDDAKTALSTTRDGLNATDMSLLAGSAHDEWMQSLPRLRRALDEMTSGMNLADVRKGFSTLSSEMATVLAKFGADVGAAIYELHCPMAFDNKGASWLQKDTETRNPYFGPAMLKCGNVVQTFGEDDDAQAEDHRHE